MDNEESCTSRYLDDDGMSAMVRRRKTLCVITIFVTHIITIVIIDPKCLCDAHFVHGHPIKYEA